MTLLGGVLVLSRKESAKCPVSTRMPEANYHSSGFQSWEYINGMIMKYISTERHRRIVDIRKR